MDSSYKILDSFKLTGHLENNFACSVSKDDRICIISDAGLYIISLKPDLSSLCNKLLCKKYFFKPSDFAICDNVGLDINQFINSLPKDILYESAFQPELSQNLKNTAPVEIGVIIAEWSDATMVNSTDCMLGVLTSIHSLEIYVKSIDQSNLMQYKMVLNLTEEILTRRKNDFVYTTRLPPVQKVNELKKRVEYIAPAVFCWGHIFTLNGQTCTVIFIGHFDGAISVFRIFEMESHADSANSEFLGRYKTMLGRISTLYWHRTQKYGGGLCIGDIEGKISLLQVTNLEKSECLMDNEVAFYKEKDTKVDKITVMTFEEHTILVAVKQSYLFLYGINQNGKLFDFTVHSVSDYYISGLTHHENILKVLTLTGSFKELVISVNFNKICVKEKPILTKVDFTGSRTHGFIESKNKVFVTMLLSPCTLKTTTKTKQLINCFFIYNWKLEPLKILLENNSGSLRSFWDCLETLRLICLKEQRFPWLGIDPNMNYDELTLLQLKTLRMIAKMSETVFNVVKKVTNYDIKSYILIHYLVEIKLIIQRLNKLFQEKNSGRELTEFEMRSIDLQVLFLKEMVVSGVLAKAQVGECFINDITQVLSIANEMEFPDMIQCHFCGEKLIGSMCIPPHAESRCCFTMMPIGLAPAYQCSICNSLANRRVKNEVGNAVLCPYCDYPMESISFNENTKNILYDLEKNSELKVTSTCREDCLIDSEEGIDDLEVNLENDETDFINLSDSDSDVEDHKDKLKEIYLKLADLGLDVDHSEIEVKN